MVERDNLLSLSLISSSLSLHHLCLSHTFSLSPPSPSPLGEERTRFIARLVIVAPSFLVGYHYVRTSSVVRHRLALLEGRVRGRKELSTEMETLNG